MISSSALPLSQQVVAWGLQALGYGDDPIMRAHVSAGTLKNAEQAAVLRSWEELVAAALARLGARPDEHLQARAEAWFRAWDLKVGALPPAADLTLRERLHAPLERAIPEVGIRLGALAALLVTELGAPADLLDDPFDASFFGRVVRELFRRRHPELESVEEQGAALKRKGIVDARTLERWYAGDLEAPPRHQHLPELGAFFGPGAEALLRLARLVCVLRTDLRTWIGREDADDWMRALTLVSRTAATALRQPFAAAALLRWFEADLAAGPGDTMLAELQEVLPPGMQVRSVREIRDRLVAAADELEAGATIDHPLARMAIALTVIVPHPQLAARLCAVHDAAILGWLPTMDFFRSIEHDWMARSLMKTIAGAGTLPITRADGSHEERSVPDRAREIARRLVATSLRFSVPSDAPSEAPELPEIFQMLYDVLGEDAFSALARRGEGGAPAPFHPAPLFTVPEEQAARTSSICRARARQLAERGDRQGALSWEERARRLGPPTTASELEDVLATRAAIAHGLLDDLRCPRAFLRAAPDGVDPTPLVAPLLQVVQLVEGIVVELLQLGAAPEGSHPQLTTLVSAIPIAVRIACLRDELASAHEGVTEQVVEQLVSHLRACLERHRGHGRGLAVVALWNRCSDRADPRSARQVEKLAVHHGAGEFLEREWTRLLVDHGSTETAAPHP